MWGQYNFLWVFHLVGDEWRCDWTWGKGSSFKSTYVFFHFVEGSRGSFWRRNISSSALMFVSVLKKKKGKLRIFDRIPTRREFLLFIPDCMKHVFQESAFFSQLISAKRLMNLYQDSINLTLKLELLESGQNCSCFFFVF